MSFMDLFTISIENLIALVLSFIGTYYICVVIKKFSVDLFYRLEQFIKNQLFLFVLRLFFWIACITSGFFLLNKLIIFVFGLLY